MNEGGTYWNAHALAGPCGLNYPLLPLPARIRMAGLIGLIVTSTSVTPLVPVANLAASATEFTRERNLPGVHLSSIKNNQRQVLQMSICLGFHPIPLQSSGALAIGTPIKIVQSSVSSSSVSLITRFSSLLTPHEPLAATSSPKPLRSLNILVECPHSN